MLHGFRIGPSSDAKLPSRPQSSETFTVVVETPAPHAPDAPHLSGAGDVVRRQKRHIFVVREM
eukprot:8645374-Alexandrium_andersonii.AAC.1